MTTPEWKPTKEQAAATRERARRATELLNEMTGLPFDHVEQDGDVVRVFFDAGRSDEATLNLVDIPVDKADDPEAYLRRVIERHTPPAFVARPFRPRGGHRG